MLKILFPLPSFLPHMDVKPWRYYSHLLGHESEGSIFALLKTQGLAQSLSAGSYTRSQDFEFFQVDIALTEAGLGTPSLPIGLLTP